MNNINNQKLENDIKNDISYNTYLNLEKLFLFSSIISNTANSLLQFPDKTEVSILGFSGITLMAYIMMQSSGGINNTKEIKQIKEIYQEFIKKYNKLNKIFDLNDPVQIHTMFNYLVSKGYLSFDKNYSFSGNQARDYKSILGANILTGKGVCRHTASMLTDILNDYNIEAGSLGVCSQEVSVNIKFIDEQKYTKEELIKWLHSHTLNDKSLNLLKEIIEYLDKNDKLNIELQYIIKEEKNYLKKLIGNHAITYAYKDGKSYYLDPTLDRIYRKEGNVLSDSELSVYPKILSSLFYLDNYNIYANMNKRIKENNPSISLEEQEKMKNETLYLCRNNTDVFEDFYNDNKDLYEETTSKILTLKKSNNVFSRS